MVANIWQGQVPSLPTKDPFQVLAINSKYAKGHPKVMAAMRASLLDAYNYMRANLDQTYAEATKVVPGFTTDLMKQAIGTGDSFPSTASISEDELSQIIAFSKTAGVDIGSPTYAQAVYPPSGS
jgi:ABC-type nitrate/sulfonate/bicarbonate transport system substrate-binding protein